MVKAVYVDLESTRSHRIKKCVRNGVPFLRYNLDRRLDAETVIDIHQMTGQIPSGFRFDVVREDSASLTSLRPEPDEGKPVSPGSPEGESHYSLEEDIHTAIDRPTGESSLFPTPQIRSLKMLSQTDRQVGSQSVVSV